RNRITTTLYGVPWVASQLGRRQLRTQTDVWIAGGRKRQHLPDAATLARLQQTLTSQENLERDEQEFLLVATEELRNRRLRRFVAALAVFVVVALVVAGLQWDRAEAERRERDRTRAELGLLEEARQAGQEVDRALLPGEQILALERVLNAQARLQGTPLENLATHDLAEVLEYSHGPRLGNALPTWRVMSRPDGSFLLGRSNLEETRGSLELRSSGGDLLEEVPLESAVSALARHGGLVWAGTRDGLLYTWDGTHLQQRRSPHRSEPVAYCYNYWPPAPRGSSHVGKPRTSPAVQQVAAIEGWALSRGSEGEVWLWPAGEGPGIFLSKDAIGATFSPDGSRVAVAHRDGRLSVY
ncbi:MAG TPA: hypothetical protein PKW90_28040, partial [Myxococcota bacterium]|nr:hypothetical protein [Myxococcota bacterium]